jgi:hypothetical protein
MTFGIYYYYILNNNIRGQEYILYKLYILIDSARQQKTTLHMSPFSSLPVVDVVVYDYTLLSLTVQVFLV